MSRRRNDPQPRRALDLWEPPREAGEAQVCIATSYTFDSDFFETECVGRFLRMDSHPSEGESVGYLIEREEKLAGCQVTAIIDRSHARGKESLRWDVLGVIVPGGIQHSKVSLLAWDRHVRVIIGSGNLTIPGYRKNLEVFGTIEANPAGGQSESIDAVIEFLIRLVDRSVGPDESQTAKRRAKESLRRVARKVRSWPNVVESASPLPILAEPGEGTLRQVLAAWPGGAIRGASVLSPFFDVPGKEERALEALLEGLAQRGDRSVDFYVRTEPLPDGRRRVFAPAGIAQHHNSRIELEVYGVDREQENEVRDLHAKMIQLVNDDWSGILIGSSNFTAAGLGVSPSGGNIEANLFYTVRDRHQSHDDLYDTWPDYTDMLLRPDDPALIWDPEPETREGGGDLVPLPASFEEAAFSPGASPELILRLGEGLPWAWSIRAGDTPILDSGETAGPGKYRVSWVDPEAPLALDVEWSTDSGTYAASWPVNVTNPSELPPPAALRDLSLEELLQILASTRSIPEAVTRVLARRKNAPAGGGDSELNPLKRFDSRDTLLRRTKRVGAALDQLRIRLERPALTRDAYEWRLKGAIGPGKLAEAFVREATMPGEAKFYLAELGLALARVRPSMPARGGLASAVVSELLGEAIGNVRTLAEGMSDGQSGSAMDDYIRSAFAEATSR